MTREHKNIPDKVQATYEAIQTSFSLAAIEMLENSGAERFEAHEAAANALVSAAALALFMVGPPNPEKMDQLRQNFMEMVSAHFEHALKTALETADELKAQIHAH